MLKKNVFLAFILFFVLLFIGIAAFYFLGKDKPGSLRTEIGTISEIKPEGSYGTIFIERDLYKAYVTIDEKTVITDSRNSKGLTFADLKLGARVEVTVPEIIIEIYPYQYATSKVVILD